MKGIVILGPTGVGKTELSIKLAKELEAEIISADSMQVYKYMDIGTAKISKDEMSGIKHYLLDEVLPTDVYSVGKYQNRVDSILNNNEAKNFLLVGGTGLYIDSIVRGLSVLPDSDEKLRKELESLSIEVLLDKLKDLDFESYEKIEHQNRVRIIRALEVCILTGNKFSVIKNKNVKNNNFDFIKIGLIRNRENIYERINKRVDIMIKQGLVDEAKYLYENYKDGLDKIKAIGYKELFDYFEGKSSLDESISEIKKNSRRYAKRQLTWFRRYDDIEWFNLDHENIENIIGQILNKWKV